MIAGLPGTGIGGTFYLICAFLMPVCEIYHTFCGNSSPSRWKLVMKQFGIASGIIGAFWLIGITILFFLPVMDNNNLLISEEAIRTSFIKFQPIVFSLTTLLFVILSVFAARNILRLNK